MKMLVVIFTTNKSIRIFFGSTLWKTIPPRYKLPCQIHCCNFYINDIVLQRFCVFIFIFEKKNEIKRIKSILSKKKDKK